MSENIVPTYRIQQYSQTLELLAQQQQSVFVPHVRQGRHQGKGASPVDQIGSIAVQQVTSRFGPITHQHANTDRRWVYPKKYQSSQISDEFDKLLTSMNNVESQEMKIAAGAFARAWDDEIVSAFFGDAKTGEEGGTTTTFPAGQQVSVSFGASAAVGITIPKIIEGIRVLMDANVDLDREEVHIAVSPTDWASLCNQAPIINKDYTSSPALDNQGRLPPKYLGLNWHVSTRLLKNGSSQRRIPIWCKDAMYMGWWEKFYSKFSQLDGVDSQPYQLYNKSMFGSTRLEEVRVVELVCA